MLRRSSALLALLPLLLAGCGGSGGHSGSGVDPNATVGPQVTIAWPARGRAFNAPAAATAALVSFPGAGANGSTPSATVLRPEGAAAITKTHLVGTGVKPGLRLMRIDFQAAPFSGFGSAPALATATLNVKVLNDGSLRAVDGKPLGTITYNSAVTAIDLVAGQTAEVGATSDLIVSATASGSVVALTPGSATFQVTSGTQYLRVNADGTVTGLAEGVATVVPTVDGVTGAPVTVEVLGAPVSSRTISIAASDVVADLTRNRLWASITSSGTNGNSIQSIDVATGTLGTRIPIGSDPSVLAISEDASTLYVGLQGSLAVRKFDLLTETAVDQFALPPSQFGSAPYALHIEVQPGSNDTIAVTTRDPQNSIPAGVAILDNGVARPNRLSWYEGNEFIWDSPSRILAFNTFGGQSGLFDVAVDADGATLINTSRVNVSLNLVKSGTRLYDNSGQVIDAASLTRIGLFTFAPSSSYGTRMYGPMIDESRNRAYFVELSSTGARLQVFDTTDFTRVGVRRIANLAFTGDLSGITDLSLVKAGPNSLALRLPDRIVILDDLSGL